MVVIALIMTVMMRVILIILIVMIMRMTMRIIMLVDMDVRMIVAWMAVPDGVPATRGEIRIDQDQIGWSWRAKYGAPSNYPLTENLHGSGALQQNSAILSHQSCSSQAVQRDATSRLMHMGTIVANMTICLLGNLKSCAPQSIAQACV
jgi:hypothetical protein